MFFEIKSNRSMTVFKCKSDKAPALYVASLSLWGSVMLHSEDGESFSVVCEPGLGNTNILSFRGLTGIRGKLFASPAGTIPEEIMDRNLASDTAVLRQMFRQILSLIARLRAPPAPA